MGINAIARYDKDVVDVTVLGDDETLAKLSRGDDEVEPYLDSRNTIGHGSHNSKSQGPKRVKIVIGGIGKDGGVCGFGRCGGRWSCGGGRTEQYSLSSEFHGRPVFTVVRSSSDVRLFSVVRSLGENRARDELRDFGEEGDGEVEIE